MVLNAFCRSFSVCDDDLFDNNNILFFNKINYFKKKFLFKNWSDRFFFVLLQTYLRQEMLKIYMKIIKIK